MKEHDTLQLHSKKYKKKAKEQRNFAAFSLAQQHVRIASEENGDFQCIVDVGRQGICTKTR